MWQNYSYIFFISKETLRRAKNGGLLHGLKGGYEVLSPGIDQKTHKPSWKYKPYFLIPGRIMWTKNIELGIRAFLKFKEKYPKYSNFSLIVAGQVDKKSGSYLRALRKISDGRKDVKFVVSPTEEKLKKLYSECYTVLLASLNEDWGLTLLEGNAYGKPTIAVNRGGPKESQIDGKTGYLVNPKVEDFVEKMAKFAENEELVRKLGGQARINVKKYDWTDFVSRIDLLLEKIAHKEL
jgi:glycosyltransferase involved in cell wall biosynthesis